MWCEDGGDGAGRGRARPQQDLHQSHLLQTLQEVQSTSAWQVRLTVSDQVIRCVTPWFSPPCSNDYHSYLLTNQPKLRLMERSLVELEVLSNCDKTEFHFFCFNFYINLLHWLYRVPTSSIRFSIAGDISLSERKQKRSASQRRRRNVSVDKNK